MVSRELWWGYKGYSVSMGSVEQSVQNDKINFTVLRSANM